MRILVTRPVEDGEAIAEKLRALGHEPLLAPLLAFQAIDGPEPDLTGVQAILASSANGIRALVRRSGRRDIAVFAVGPQTTEEARKAGFITVKNADGDAHALADATARWTIADKGALLHVCGAKAPGTLGDDLRARGFDVRRAVPLLHGVTPPQTAFLLAPLAVLGWIVTLLVYNETRRRVVHYL